MKKAFFIPFVAFVILAGCKKETQSNGSAKSQWTFNNITYKPNNELENSTKWENASTYSPSRLDVSGDDGTGIPANNMSEVSISFKSRPVASRVYTISSSRWPDSDTTCNITFSRTSPIDGYSYRSYDASDKVEVTVKDSKITIKLTDIKMKGGVFYDNYSTLSGYFIEE